MVARIELVIGMDASFDLRSNEIGVSSNIRHFPLELCPKLWTYKILPRTSIVATCCQLSLIDKRGQLVR